MAPMISAETGVTLPQGAVIDTRPEGRRSSHSTLSHDLSIGHTTRQHRLKTTRRLAGANEFSSLAPCS